MNDACLTHCMQGAEYNLKELLFSFYPVVLGMDFRWPGSAETVFPQVSSQAHFASAGHRSPPLNPGP